MKVMAMFLRAITLVACLPAPTGAQTYFECRDAAGHIIFSDRVCQDAVQVQPLARPRDTDSPELKAQSDARIQKDKALADQVQSNRLAKEQAGYAAQNQQVQTGNSLTNKLEQERSQQRATTNSTLPATTSAPTTPVTVP